MTFFCRLLTFYHLIAHVTRVRKPQGDCTDKWAPDSGNQQVQVWSTRRTRDLPVTQGTPASLFLHFPNWLSPDYMILFRSNFGDNTKVVRLPWDGMRWRFNNTESAFAVCCQSTVASTAFGSKNLFLALFTYCRITIQVFQCETSRRFEGRRTSSSNRRGAKWLRDHHFSAIPKTICDEKYAFYKLPVSKKHNGEKKLWITCEINIKWRRTRGCLLVLVLDITLIWIQKPHTSKLTVSNTQFTNSTLNRPQLFQKVSFSLLLLDKINRLHAFFLWDWRFQIRAIWSPSRTREILFPT